MEGESVVNMLVKLYNCVWNEEKVPSKWNKSRMVCCIRVGTRAKKI